jgi:hypothetical protein
MKAQRKAVMERTENKDDDQDKEHLVYIDQEIRVQEIVLEELTKKYGTAEHTATLHPASGDLAQLDRAVRTIGKIEDRMLTIQSELRATSRVSRLAKAVITSP